MDDARRVDAVGVTGQGRIERGSMVAEAKPEVEIVTVRQRFIEAAQFDDEVLAGDYARRANEILVKQAACEFRLLDESPAATCVGCRKTAKYRVRVGDRRFEHVSVSVHFFEVTEREASRGVPIQGINALGELAW